MNSLSNRYKPRKHNPFPFGDLRISRVKFSRWFYLFAFVVLFYFTFFIALEAASKELSTTASVNVRKPQSAAEAIPDPCGLRDVECPNERQNANKGQVSSTKLESAPTLANQETLRATVTTYQAVAAQTDASPCSGAMPGVDFCHPPRPLAANNCLKLGTEVEIRGETYLVADRMNSRYGCDHFDILTDGANYTLTNEPVAIL